MAKPQISSLCLFTLLLTAFAATAQPPPLEAFIYGGCSPVTYTPNSAFSSTLSSLLTSLTNSASSSSYTHLTLTSQNDVVVHGLYQCRGDLPGPACASCVARAVSQLGATCPSSSGAAVQLQGCYAKYDAASFFGVEDKAVVFKKCGPDQGGKSAGPALDEVLSGLVNGTDDGAMYKAVGSGSVRGMAQCVGDLSVDQCRDCVDQAVRTVKSDCGSAAAYGDVFLGKCYARFGVAATGSVGGGAYDKSLGTVKMFAIIAGLLAGIVILVLFFTFLCRAFGGQHSSGK